LRWLDRYPAIREVYTYKEALHRLCRIRGYRRARKAFIRLTDQMANSTLPEIKTLRSTPLRWRTEILAYFAHPITNGRTEGFNNKAKVG
jgi:transposase